MTVIADLAVTLTAVTGRFAEGFRTAGDHVAHFGHKLHELKESLFSIANAEIVILGREMIEFAHHTYEAVEANEKLAERLGTSVKELHGLEFAAKLTGGNIEELRTSMTQMMKNLSKDTPELAKAFQSLGLRVSELRQLSPAEALGKIADGMKNVGTASERTLIAMEIFGRGGAGMVNMLAKGSAGLEEMAKESASLRGELSALDTERIKTANEQFKRLGEEWEGIKEKLAAKLAPVLSRMVDWLLKIGDYGESGADRVVNGIERMATKLKPLLGLLEKAAGYVEKIMGDSVASKDDILRGANHMVQGPHAKDLYGKLADESAASRARNAEMHQDAVTDELKDIQRRRLQRIETFGTDEAAKEAASFSREAFVKGLANNAVNEFSPSAIMGDLGGALARKPVAGPFDLHAIARGTFAGDRIGQLGSQSDPGQRAAKALDDLLELAKTGGLKVSAVLDG